MHSWSRNGSAVAIWSSRPSGCGGGHFRDHLGTPWPDRVSERTESRSPGPFAEALQRAGMLKGVPKALLPRAAALTLRPEAAALTTPALVAWVRDSVELRKGTCWDAALSSSSGTAPFNQEWQRRVAATHPQIGSRRQSGPWAEPYSVAANAARFRQIAGWERRRQRSDGRDRPAPGAVRAQDVEESHDLGWVEGDLADRAVLVAEQENTTRRRQGESGRGSSRSQGSATSWPADAEPHSKRHRVSGVR
jgi:hypothetical protein